MLSCGRGSNRQRRTRLGGGRVPPRQRGNHGAHQHGGTERLARHHLHGDVRSASCSSWRCTSRSTSPPGASRRTSSRATGLSTTPVRPRTPKWLHAVHMTSMIILGFTGMYLRFPFFVQQPRPHAQHPLRLHDHRHRLPGLAHLVRVLLQDQRRLARVRGSQEGPAVHARGRQVLRLLQQREAARRQVQRHAEAVLQPVPLHDDRCRRSPAC